RSKGASALDPVIDAARSLTRWVPLGKGAGGALRSRWPRPIAFLPNPLASKRFSTTIDEPSTPAPPDLRSRLRGGPAPCMSWRVAGLLEWETRGDERGRKAT